MDKVTIATSSGFLWLALVTHFGSALIALCAGTVALVVAKGGRLHKKSGMVFSYGMVAAGILASGIAYYEGNKGSVFGGFFVVYLIYTAVTTVKPVSFNTRQLQIGLMLFAFMLSALYYWRGVAVWSLPGHAEKGVPAGMILFLATVTLLAAIGDLRMLLGEPLRGSRRLARHLWRMCFGLFIATGSFFIGQMKFVPAPIRWTPLMFALGIAPLPILLYWMWRVRLRRKLTGMILSSPTVSQPG